MARAQAAILLLLLWLPLTAASTSGHGFSGSEIIGDIVLGPAGATNATLELWKHGETGWSLHLFHLAVGPDARNVTFTVEHGAERVVHTRVASLVLRIRVNDTGDYRFLWSNPSDRPVALDYRVALRPPPPGPEFVFVAILGTLVLGVLILTIMSEVALVWGPALEGDDEAPAAPNVRRHTGRRRRRGPA